MKGTPADCRRSTGSDNVSQRIDDSSKDWDEAAARKLAEQ